MFRRSVMMLGVMLSPSLLLMAQQGSAEIAKAAGEELARGENAELQARLEDQLKEVMTDEVLTSLRDHAFQGAGTFEKADTPRCKAMEANGQDMEMCVVPLLFAYKTISVRFVIEPDGRIEAMYLASTANR